MRQNDSPVKNKLQRILLSPWMLLSLYVIFAVVASVQSLSLQKKPFVDGGIAYTQYNNYTIFKQSFYHLTAGTDLYVLYPEEHWDLYKYSPSFSLAFGPMAVLPDSIGLTIWNLLNALFLLWAIYALPGIDLKSKGSIGLICLVELLTSMQNEQSNGLIAGWIILAFCYLEKRQYMVAILLIVGTVFIKLFGIVAFALYLFYPQKWKLVLFTSFWALILLVLPLLVINLDQYIFLMESWKRMLSEDHSASLGYSVMGWLHSWFGLGGGKIWVLLTGVGLFLIPLWRIRLYRDMKFRVYTLCSILIWVVIFNHKAESPTFIIAMAGVAIWFMYSDKSKLDIFLFVLAFIFTSLSPTDLFPAQIRRDFVLPYVLKVVPCIWIWCKIIWDMLRLNPGLEYENRGVNQV